MRQFLIVGACLMSASASAQSPLSPSAPPTAPLAIASPNYVTQRIEIIVDRPAAQTWSRIGHFCDMKEWLPRDCSITSGKEGELGAVRTLPGGTVEVIVALTPMSYTYAFPVRVGPPYTMQHNTLEVQAIDAQTSRIVYSFLWDNSTVPASQRGVEMTARRDRLLPALQRMKDIVESGKSRP